MSKLYSPSTKRWVETVTTYEGPAKRKKAEPFVIVPLGWAVRATKATSTPQALVWIRLLHLAWKAKTRTICLPSKWLEDQGVSRFAKNRALDGLEAGGLISVERRHRKSPRVTLT
jgi:hypothetical protein